MLVEEEDRVVTHLGAEAKFRVAQWLGTGKGPYSRVQGLQVLSPLVPPHWLCHYSQGWRTPGFSNPSACFWTQMVRKRDSTKNNKIVPESKDDRELFYQGLGYVPAKAYLYTWPQSESFLRDDQTTRRSEPLVERLIQHQIYLRTLKGLKK